MSCAFVCKATKLTHREVYVALVAVASPAIESSALKKQRFRMQWRRATTQQNDEHLQ